MIDLLIVKGPVGRPQPHHKHRLAEVEYRRFLARKVKVTSTFVLVPPMFAQIEVRYWIEESGIAWVWMKIPLATATVGQNLIHSGLSDTNLEQERRCASLLAKVVLHGLNFNEKEVERFICSAEVEMCELTWHTSTASERAKRNLLDSTIAAFERMKQQSRLRDVGLRDVDVRRKNGAASVLATLKTKDEFRQYDKHQQAQSRPVRSDRLWSIAAEYPARQEILAAIQNHVRNEVRLEAKTLKKHGLLHPSSLTAGTLEKALTDVLALAGLGIAQTGGVTSKAVSPQAMDTWNKWRQGEDLSTLAAHTRSRHRKAIKAAGGPDIAFPLIKGHGQRTAASIGRQIKYDKCWRPPAELDALALNSRSGLLVGQELERGLAFMLDGVLPDDLESDELDAWMARWGRYLRSVRGE